MLAYELDPCQDAPSRARMDLRTSPEAKGLIERAARALGISSSEFVTAAACREARETLTKCEVTHVPPEAAQAFVDAFEREDPAPGLVSIMRLHATVSAKRAARAEKKLIDA